MGLASAQVGFSSNALLAACLTELIIDTPREKKRLGEVLLPLSDCHDSRLSQVPWTQLKYFNLGNICSNLL